MKQTVLAIAIIGLSFPVLEARRRTPWQGTLGSIRRRRKRRVRLVISAGATSVLSASDDLVDSLNYPPFASLTGLSIGSRRPCLGRLGDLRTTDPSGNSLCKHRWWMTPA